MYFEPTYVFSEMRLTIVMYVGEKWDAGTARARPANRILCCAAKQVVAKPTGYGSLAVASSYSPSGKTDTPPVLFNQPSTYALSELPFRPVSGTHIY